MLSEQMCLGILYFHSEHCISDSVASGQIEVVDEGVAVKWSGRHRRYVAW